jgi:hypothetical protein
VAVTIAYSEYLWIYIRQKKENRKYGGAVCLKTGQPEHTRQQTICRISSNEQTDR